MAGLQSEYGIDEFYGQPNLAPARSLVDKNTANYIVDPTEEFELKDSKWAKGSFLLGAGEFPKGSVERYSLFRSSADYTWEDTSPGGNTIMNPKPQYTRYSDPRRKGIRPQREDVDISIVSGTHGMGRLYHEYIQQAQEATYLRFGIIENISLIHFLLVYSDPDLTSMHSSGHHGISKRLGEVAAAGGMFLFSRWVFGLIPTMLYTFVSAGVNFLQAYFGANSSSEFYRLRPMMPFYWLAVNSMVNMLMMEEGTIAPSADASGDAKRRVADPEVLKALHKDFPDYFTIAGGVDVAAIAARSGTRWYEAIRTYNLFLSGDANPDVSKTSRKEMNDTTLHHVKMGKDPGTDVPEEGINLKQLKDYMALKAVGPIPKTNGDGSSKKADLHQSDRTKTNTELLKELRERTSNIKDAFVEQFKDDNGILKYLVGEAKSGTAFAVLGFDSIGGISDSFSVSTSPSKLGDTMNSVSDTSRELSFEFGGVRADADIIVDSVKAVGGMLSTFAGGAADMANKVFMSIPSAVSSLFKGAKVDIPDHVSDATASIGTTSLSVTLIATSQHPLAKLTDIYIPLAMLMAAIAPRQTGSASYVMPFMCSAFQRGKFNIPLGVCESLTIERATSNLPYDPVTGAPLAFKCTLSIKDLAPVAHMLMPSPVEETSLSEQAAMMTGDTPFGRWIRTIAGRGMEDDFFPMSRNRIRFKTAFQIAGFQCSRARLAMMTNNFLRSIPLAGDVMDVGASIGASISSPSTASVGLKR